MERRKRMPFETDMEMAISIAPQISRDYVDLMKDRNGSDDPIKRTSVSADDFLSLTEIIGRYAAGRGMLNEKEVERYHGALRAHSICYGLDANRAQEMVDTFVLGIRDNGDVRLALSNVRPEGEDSTERETSVYIKSQAEESGLTLTQTVRIQEEEAHRVLDMGESNPIREESA